jgi:type II secretory pathway pseudopilin PulG
MKRSSKSSSGVTLLEIMLVLAIAAMVIVMSIRYYQSASSSQQANSVLEQIQAISAAGDNLAQGSDYTAVTTTTLQNVLGGSSKLSTPWGGITVSGTSTSSTYSISIPSVPGSVCQALVSQLKANTRFTGVTSSCTAGTAAVFTYTYNSTL